MNKELEEVKALILFSSILFEILNIIFEILAKMMLLVRFYVIVSAALRY